MKTHSAPRPQSRLAFTVVELLGSIAIVAILAALILPSVKSMISASEGAKCAGQLRSIGTLLSTYAADNDGKTVSTYSMGGLNWSVLVSGGEQGNVSAGGVSKDVWRCPSNKKQTFQYEGDEQGEHACSYTINGFYDEQNHPTYYDKENRYTANRLGNFTHPSKTYAVFEGTYYRSQVGGDGYDKVRWPHRDSMNILFADGHVESLKKTEDGKLPGFGNFRGAVWPDDNSKAVSFENGEAWFAN